MDIKELYEKTELTQAQIGAQLGLTQQQVSNKIKRLFSSEFRKNRKAVCYRNSKVGNKNPMYEKFAEQHHNFMGVVSDKKGYWMQLKPSWYTGRKNSKHVFVHHIVLCTHLKLTAIPKGWCVHHCDFNSENNSFNNLVLLTIGDHARLHRYLEGVTTISKESTLKWVETHGTPFRRDDIV